MLDTILYITTNIIMSKGFYDCWIKSYLLLNWWMKSILFIN